MRKAKPTPPKTNRNWFKTLVFAMCFIATGVFSFNATAQGSRIADNVLEAKTSQEFEAWQLFDMSSESARLGYSQAVRDGLTFDMDITTVRRLKQDPPAYMQLELPFDNADGKIELDLIRTDIHLPNFTVRTSAEGNVTGQYDLGTHYRGIISGDARSLVSISIFNTEVHGIIADAGGNYELGRLRDSESNHILYRESDLLQPNEMVCLMEPGENDRTYSPSELTFNRRDAGDCIGLYVEAGESVYNSFGDDLGQTINFVNAMFAENITFYAGQGIDSYLEDMFIWITPDPYDETTLGGRGMRDTFQVLTDGFTGDLAMLIEVTGGCTGTNCGAGGIAAGFNGICPDDPDDSKAYTGMQSTDFNNVPTYTRNMKVVIHEFGHLYGSRHTHACVWNGDDTQIDDCGNVDAVNDGDDPEGEDCFDEDNPILPGMQGGTIMSYCDRNPFTGVNFALGLNNQVLAVMLNDIADGDCLSADCCTNDSAEPTALCQDITVQLDAGGEASVSAQAIDDGSFDACGDITLAIDGADAQMVDCADVGSNTFALLVTDESGNTNGCTATVEVEDNVPPEAICQDISVYLEYEVCTVSIEPEDVDGGSNDACGIDDLSVDVSFFDTGDVGDNTVTLTVTDVNGNVSSCEATVTVLKRPTTLTNLGDFDGQYSDYPVLQARLLDQLSGLPLAGRDITFTLGPNVLVAETDASGIAEVTLRLGYEYPPTALGFNYTILTEYAGEDCYEPSMDEDVFTVLQEDARVTYTGKNFASTGSEESSEAVVLLAATVCDISNSPDAGGDTDPGSVVNATVTFVDRDNGDAPISPPLTVVPLPGDTTKGTVVFDWTVDIGAADCATFNIGIVVGNYYLRDAAADDEEITVCKPDRQSVTGGGFVVLESSFGILPGDDGSHCNFGFNCKFKGRDQEIDGNLNIIYRRTEQDGVHQYQIKATEIPSLGVDSDNDFAEFCGTAKLTDLTDGVVEYDEAMFILKLEDNGNPGKKDRIGFALYAPDGGLIFSSHWSGTETLLQHLNGGNLKIHTRGNSRDLAGLTDDGSDLTRVSGISAEVYPNPFRGETAILFELERSAQTRIEVVDISGLAVVSEELGYLEAGLLHIWTFEADDLKSGNYVYRIQSGDHLVTGQIVHLK